MNSIDVKVPNLGVEGAMEVIEVCVSVGDDVNQDDSIIVLESDKATVEVPCPAAGKVDVINVSVGDKILEGEPVLVLFNDEESVGDAVAEHVHVVEEGTQPGRSGADRGQCDGQLVTGQSENVLHSAQGRPPRRVQKRRHI